MKSEWKKLDHQGGSWGLCDENDVIQIYLSQDYRGWGIYGRDGSPQANKNRYGSRDSAMRKAEELVANEAP